MSICGSHVNNSYYLFDVHLPINSPGKLNQFFGFWEKISCIFFYTFIIIQSKSLDGSFYVFNKKTQVNQK